MSIVVWRHKESWADKEIVLVRRVVEARRLAASGGAAPLHPIRTAALPPVNEKDNTSPSAQDEKDRSKLSFWKKLRCW